MILLLLFMHVGFSIVIIVELSASVRWLSQPVNDVKRCVHWYEPLTYKVPNEFEACIYFSSASQKVSLRIFFLYFDLSYYFGFLNFISCIHWLFG